MLPIEVTKVSDRDFKNIRNKDKFFEEAMDFKQLKLCEEDEKKTFSDMDAYAERKGRFLIIEKKSSTTYLQGGQLYSMQAFHRLGVFTILILQGSETAPKAINIWQEGKQPKLYFPEATKELLDEITTYWYDMADTKQTPNFKHIWKKHMRMLGSEHDEDEIVIP